VRAAETADQPAVQSAERGAGLIVRRPLRRMLLLMKPRRRREYVAIVDDDVVGRIV
jgi:hypothetical protein